MNHPLSGRISRRQLLGRTATIIGGVAVGVALTDVGLAPAAKATGFQDKWLYCHYCQGLWNSVYGTNVCCGSPNGRHIGSGSNNYVMDSTPGIAGQSNWRWCRNCALLHYSTTGGICPNGRAAHVATGSRDYTVFYLGDGGDWDPGDGQPNWRYCTSCRGMWWYGNSKYGACPTSRGHHVVGSSRSYVLDFLN